MGCIVVLGTGLVALLYVSPFHLIEPFRLTFDSAGYPLISHFTSPKLSTLGGFNIGGINASGQVRFLTAPDFLSLGLSTISQVPSMAGNWGLIDVQTPKAALTKTSYHDGTELQLVFSDEFNIEGRTFYPGDDPYWEGADLHYWAVRYAYRPAAHSLT